MGKQRNWIVDDETIKDAETPSRFSGAYEVIIKEAVTDLYPGGAEWVKLRISIPSKPNDEGLPKEYNIERQTITSGDAKGNAPTFYMGIFQSPFKLLNVSNKVGKAPALVWDKEEKSFVSEKVDQYVELLEKKVGAVVRMKMEYPQKLIDGYTKEELPRGSYKQYPYAVYIPVYLTDEGSESKLYSRFSVERFYSIAPGTYGKTATEMMEGKPATDIAKNVKYIEGQDITPIPMTDSQMNDYILKQLQKSLKKIGEDYDQNLWEDYGTGSDEDVPF